jgi:hypothetical protein
MAVYNNLPGFVINTIDRGLSIQQQPVADSTLIISTAGQGPANQPFQVTDRAMSAQTFGFQGNLVRAQEEVMSAGCDNVILFRMGTTPMALNAVGRAPLLGPVAPTGTPSATGGTMAASTTNYAVIVAVDANGNFAPGVQSLAVTTTGSIASIAWAWTAVSGAASYRIYVGTTTGAEANYFTSATNSFNQIAPPTSGTAGTVPVANTTGGGFNLGFGQVTSTAVTDYTVWYNNGVVCVYYKGSLVFSNDPAQTTDTGDITVTGLITGNTGLQVGTGVAGTPANAITVQAAAALSGTATAPAPLLSNPVTGVGLTGRQNFIAFMQAINLLQGFQVKQVVVPEAQFDAPNVPYFVSGDSTSVLNNPATNASALDWLKTTVDAYGNPVFQWASETTDSTGATVSAMSAATPALRIAAGFREISWGYALANFCASLSQINNTCIGFIGCSAPATFKLVDVRKWVGYLPTYNASGFASVPGKGLCGIPYAVGTTTAGLNTLCADFAQGYRKAGFFLTVEGVYDGTVVVDKNNNPVDIGAYIHVVADEAIMSNGFATNYVANLACYVAGVTSQLDEKVALTNQPLTLVQLPALVYTPGQLDSLTAANINVLRTKGLNASPALLHDQTAATSASDYTQVLRMRIKGLAVATLLTVGDPFIGASSLDGLQCTAMKTALDNALTELVKRGYMSGPQVTITSSVANQRLGKASLFLTFHPADQLVQLTANVAFS